MNEKTDKSKKELRDEYLQNLQKQELQLKQNNLNNHSFIKWYWKDEHNIWIEFEKEIQAELEERYKRNESSMIYRSKNDNKSYMIGFSTMKRYNLENKKTNDIVRVVHKAPSPSKICEFPEYWSPFTNYKFEEVHITPSSNEAAWIVNKFYETMPEDKYEIVSLFRIQHLGRWLQYQACHKMLKSKSNSVERHLFHGTSNESVWQIIEEHNLAGLDPRFNKRARYGWGCYFSTDASLAHNYCTPDEKSGKFYMLVCRVSPGRYTVGTPFDKRPPDGFDSTVDDTQNPKIFIISLHTQIYVEYLLVYKIKKNN